jgi:long-chain acyl-CoA synthetase
MFETQPWLRHYGDAPRSLDYPRATLCEALADSVRRFPDATALDFLGQRATYRELGEAVDRCASGFAAIGLSAGERVAIALPTTPQGVIAFYAALRLGAVPAMLPTAAMVAEIACYLDATRCRFAVTVDAFYGQFAAARPGTALERLVLARIPECLGPLQRLGYWAEHGNEGPAIKGDPSVSWWKDVAEGAGSRLRPAKGDRDDVAAILFTNGATGRPKGVELTHRNFIAVARQVSSWVDLGPGESILAAMPLHSGFGIGVCVNAALMHGACAVLVPQSGPAEVARQLRRARPHLLAGTPTLYDALLREPAMRTADLSRLRAMLSGGDKMPRGLKERFEAHVAARGGNVRLFEGYWLTETVSAALVTPPDEYREGSIGVPLADNFAKVVRPGTRVEVDPGSEGEICVCGPSVMKGYLDDPVATAKALQVHADGRTWLHTGDLGRMDYDGYFYFTCRLERVIHSSGFDVYPTQVEAVLAEHPAVAEACVVGVPDGPQERVKAYIVLRSGVKPSPSLADQLIAHCRTHLLRGSCPGEIEFLQKLPRVSNGEVDIRALAPRTLPAHHAH